MSIKNEARQYISDMNMFQKRGKSNSLHVLSKREDSELPDKPFRDLRKLKRRKSGVPHSLWSWLVSNGVCVSRDAAVCTDEWGISHWSLSDWREERKEIELIDGTNFESAVGDVIAVWFESRQNKYFQGLYKIVEPYKLKMMTNKYNLNNGAVIGHVSDIISTGDAISLIQSIGRSFSHDV